MSEYETYNPHSKELHGMFFGLPTYLTEEEKSATSSSSIESTEPPTSTK